MDDTIRPISPCAEYLLTTQPHLISSRLDTQPPSPRAIRWLTVLIVALLALVTAAIYAPGLGGGFMFDDFPNIVDNPAIQPVDASLAHLTAAALSSPSSELKRPLSSLSFAANFLTSGLDPAAMKITNLVIHFLNGILLFALLRLILPLTWTRTSKLASVLAAGAMSMYWLVMPINLTGVLYVVQRMESLANLFVLLGLICYVRLRNGPPGGTGHPIRAIICVVTASIVGLLAKETAILLPLYALCVELVVFRFRTDDNRFFRGLACIFGVILIPPLVVGTLWLGPGILDHKTWATRDFTLATRLWSEPRILLDYIHWTVLPVPADLSFYHDDFAQSTGWLSPISTLASIGALVLLAVTAWRARQKWPLSALGITLFFACHTLTGTVLPLELIYEHRNYFASIGVIMVIADLTHTLWDRLSMYTGRLRIAALIPATALVIWAAGVTVYTAEAWGTPLGLAEELGRRGPDSPRAQYELGRAYIIDSRYNAESLSATKAYAPLEHAAKLPGSSILPQQALIFLNSRMNRPVAATWWASMRTKLESRPATIQDESSLEALASCLRQAQCDFPADELNRTFQAAESHPGTSARLAGMHANFAWYTLADHSTALRLEHRAVANAPKEGAYRITLIRMLIQVGHMEEAQSELSALKALNIGGRYDADIANLQSKITRSKQ